MKHKSSESRIEEKLLRRIFSDPLDHGYQQLAEGEYSTARMGLWGKVLTVLLTTILVAGTVFAVKDLTKHNVQEDSLAPLRTQIDEARTKLGKAELANRNLVSQIKDLSKDVESGSDDSVNSLDSINIFEAVEGPGIEVTLSDGTILNPTDPEANSKRVQDRDLQTVANQLWATGAEAISLNGKRLGPQTAIRAAGGAVLVDLKPVSSPYVLSAIGNQEKLMEGVSTGPTADFLGILQTRYGISTSVSRKSKIDMAPVAYQRYKTAIIKQ